MGSIWGALISRMCTDFSLFCQSLFLLSLLLGRNCFSFLICKMGTIIIYLNGVFFLRTELWLSLALFLSTHVSSFETWINSSQNNSGLGVCGRGEVAGTGQWFRTLWKVWRCHINCQHKCEKLNHRAVLRKQGWGRGRLCPWVCSQERWWEEVTMRERLQKPMKRRQGGSISFWPICLCGRGNHKIDHCVIGHSYIIYQFSNTSEINKKRKGRRQHITWN